MSRYFISAGWPYLYDIPGLHNCIPMLFADVYARFFRQMGHEVYFLCGGDEHGSRIEFVARGYQQSPQDLVNEKYEATVPLLKKLGISLDHFGRTTDPHHQVFVREFINRVIVRRNALWKEHLIPYCRACGLYLPDRFIQGTCPYCGELTYGGQCSNKKTCGMMIEAVNQAHCALCGGDYELIKRNHLLFDMRFYREQVLLSIASAHSDASAVRDRIDKTFATIDEVSLTRDSSWGVSLPGLHTKEQSVYSWVDSLLAKVSFLATAGKESEYWKDDNTVRVFFLGMDGVPFYGALFPSLLLAAEAGYSISNWTLLPNEVFIYEGGVCSKSTGTGIWLQEALSVLEPDLWRFYIYYHYALSQKDVDFRWDKFAETVNVYLVDTLERSIVRAYCNADGKMDSAALQVVRDQLCNYEAAKALLALLHVIDDANVTRSTLSEALSLLSCFVPQVATRALEKLEGKLDPDLSITHKFHGEETRIRYQQLVEARRNNLNLCQEITDMRADSLCVCPTSLKEQ